MQGEVSEGLRGCDDLGDKHIDQQEGHQIKSLEQWSLHIHLHDS